MPVVKKLDFDFQRFARFPFAKKLDFDLQSFARFPFAKKLNFELQLFFYKQYQHLPLGGLLAFALRRERERKRER